MLVRPTLSVTLMAIEPLPAVVGVPESTPELAPKVRPGTAPLTTDHEYGALPPEAERVAEYAVPTVAPGRVEGLMVTVLVVTFRVYWAVA